MSEPSERMQELVRTLRHAQHQAARTNTVTEDLVVADMELCSAIAALEQRAEKAEAERGALRTRLQGMTRCDHHSPATSATICCPDCFAEIRAERDKWKRVAVAKQTVEMLRLAHKPIRAAEFQEVRDAIADLGDEWMEAVK